jgi:hypothetical protein
MYGSLFPNKIRHSHSLPHLVRYRECRSRPFLSPTSLTLSLPLLCKIITHQSPLTSITNAPLPILAQAEQEPQELESLHSCSTLFAPRSGGARTHVGSWRKELRQDRKENNWCNHSLVLRGLTGDTMGRCKG